MCDCQYGFPSPDNPDGITNRILSTGNHGMNIALLSIKLYVQKFSMLFSENFHFFKGPNRFWGP